MINAERDYHNSPKKYIGSSDSAALTIHEYNDKKDKLIKLDKLHFAEDGEYMAYIVTDPRIEIPEHYHKVYAGHNRIIITSSDAIEDDDCIFDADNINIYRSGNFGCIIQVLNNIPADKALILKALYITYILTPDIETCKAFTKLEDELYIINKAQCEEIFKEAIDIVDKRVNALINI